jgi:hypothetical protein
MQMQTQFQRGDRVSAIRVVPHPTKRNEYVGERQEGLFEAAVSATRWPAGSYCRRGVDAFVRWSDGSGDWQPIENLTQRVEA